MTKPEDPLSEAAIAAIRAHPAFRQACETAAQKALEGYDAHSPALRWVLKDIGRFGIGVTALVLHAIGDLSLHTLTAACKANAVASVGRVRQVVARCVAAGEAEIVADPRLRPTRRKIVLAPSFLDAFQRRARIEMEVVAAFDPELAPLLDVAATPAGFLAYLAAAAAISTARRDLLALGEDTPAGFFFQREAGGLILQAFLRRQPADRERLLTSAPLSRSALARRFDVSRAHLNKLLSEAGRRGYLSLPDPDRIDFAPALSDDLERRQAIFFQLQHASWRAMQGAL